MSTLDQDRWKKMSPLLDQALSLEGRDRVAWIKALQARDPDAAAYLEGLLDEHSVLASEHFLERGPVQPAAADGFLGGRQVGAYRLLRPLGQGGMGTVWLAERSDGRFDRRVALKFLHFSIAPQTAERFKSEGKILGKLAHPHIAELIDAGVSAHGEPYLVLEHVEGQQIDAYCDDHRLDLRARIGLFLDVVAAVAHAHANLIVHRDIKPSNVFVRNDGQVKLLDFGIAKLLADEGNAGKTFVTAEGGAVLTPQFAAPEQINGAAITTATDVYSLGVLLYLLLTGRHPAGPGPYSPADLVKAIVETETPKASTAVGLHDGTPAAEKRGAGREKIRRQLRGDLDTILAKALKKNPEERYASATAFADDLCRYLRHEPIGARPDSPAYRAVKFIRRNRVAVSLATITLIAVLAGATTTFIQARIAREQRDFALQQVGRAETVNEFNDFLISEASASGKPFTVDDLLKRAETILSKEHGTDDNRVELMANIGTQYSLEDKEDKAQRILDEAYKLSKGVNSPSARAVAACSLGSSLNRNGETERAEALFQEGWKELPDEPQFALSRVDCLRRGSEIAQERGNAREGVARMILAQQIARRSPLDSGWLEFVTSLDLGEAYRMAGDNYRASQIFESVNTLVSNLGRADTQTAGVLYNDWGLALEKLGRSREAEQLIRRDIDINRVGQTDDSVPPIILNNYAITLRYLGRLNEAANYSEEAYNKAKQEEDTFTIYRALNLRALIYIDQQDFKRAAAMVAELQPIVYHNFASGTLWFGVLALDQALVASGQRDSQRGLQLADQAVEVIQQAIKTGGQGADTLPSTLLSRSAIELEARRPAPAAADASRAVQLLEAAGPPGAFSSHIAAAYLQLGKCLIAEGKMDEAQAAFKSAADHFANTLGADDPQTEAAKRLAGKPA